MVREKKNSENPKHVAAEAVVVVVGGGVVA